MRNLSRRSYFSGQGVVATAFSSSALHVPTLTRYEQQQLRAQTERACRGVTSLRLTSIRPPHSFVLPMTVAFRLHSTVSSNCDSEQSGKRTFHFSRKVCSIENISKGSNTLSQHDMSEKPIYTEGVVQKLKSLVGLDDKNANDLSTKPERVADLLSFFEEHHVAPDTLRELKVMLFNVWAKVKGKKHRDILAQYVVGGKFDIMQKVDAAIRYLAAINDESSDVNTDELDKHCGVGVQITEAHVRDLVEKAIKSEDLEELRASWLKNPNMLLGKMRRVEGLRWASVEHIQAALKSQVPKHIESGCIEVKKENEIGATPAPAASGSSAKKGQDVCPCNSDFSAVANGLPITRIGELESKEEGTAVYVIGWAHRVRHQSRVSFVVLRDGTGYVQCVLNGVVEPFHRESSLAIRGTLRAEPRAKNDLQPPIELQVQEYSVIGKSDGAIETIITPESSVDKLLDQRHLVFRGTFCTSVLKVRHELIRTFREYFWNKGYYEVNPPTIVETECEGGSTLFDMLYYNETAHLTQSSQLYLETVTSSLGNVFCCLPSYRAEKSKTKRHLSEYTHLEVEYDICTFEDLLTRLEDLICTSFDSVILRAGHLVALLNPSQVIDPDGDLHDPANYKYRPKRPFRRMKYSEAIEFCNANGIINPETGKAFKFGEGISDQPERAILDKLNEIVLMTHFPREMVSFYMQPDLSNPGLTESVDVLAPGVGEIVGGSMRMWKLDELTEAYKKGNMDPTPYYWYLDQRRFGGVPHGGFGLGVERLLVWLLDLDSVRDACLFPRTMGRCRP